LPREFSEGDSAEKGFAGYFIPGDEKIWNEADDLGSLPDSWAKSDRTGHLRIAPNYPTRVPVSVFVEKGGTGETSAPYGVARDEAMKQAGVKFKNWLTSRNENLRPSHQAAEEQTVGLHEVFIVGATKLMFPGDPSGPPEEVINCHCVQIAAASKGNRISTKMLRHRPNFGPKP
jgi:hypothetical protein